MFFICDGIYWRIVPLAYLLWPLFYFTGHDIFQHAVISIAMCSIFHMRIDTLPKYFTIQILFYI